MLKQIVAALVVAAVGTGAGLYYGLTATNPPAPAGASSLPVAEHGCCASKKAESLASLSLGAACPASAEATVAVPDSESLAACTGVLTVGTTPTKKKAFNCCED